MKNKAIRIEKIHTSEDKDLRELFPMVESAFALTMEGCPEEERGIEIPRGEDLIVGLENGMDLWKIYNDDSLVGGAMISVKEKAIAFLELLFIAGNAEGKGIGVEAWEAIENAYPDIKIWETVTPCFQKRNTHFYVNKCGFHIVAYHNKWNPIMENGKPSNDEMFAFRKEL